jgi:hypothetical protein
MNTSIEPPQTSSREEFNTAQKNGHGTISDAFDFFSKKYRSAFDKDELVDPDLTEGEVKNATILSDEAIREYLQKEYEAKNIQLVHTSLGVLNFPSKVSASISEQLDFVVSYLRDSIEKPIRSAYQNQSVCQKPVMSLVYFLISGLVAIIGLVVEWAFMGGTLQNTGLPAYISTQSALLSSFLIVMCSLALKAIIEDSKFVLQQKFKSYLGILFVVLLPTYAVLFNINFQALPPDAEPFYSPVISVSTFVAQVLLGVVASNLIFLNLKKGSENYLAKTVSYDPEYLAYDEEKEGLNLRGVDVDVLIRRIEGFKLAYTAGLDAFVTKKLTEVLIVKTEVTAIKLRHASAEAQDIADFYARDRSIKPNLVAVK